MKIERCPCCGQSLPTHNREEVLANIKAYQSKLSVESEKKIRKELEENLKQKYDKKLKQKVDEEKERIKQKALQEAKSEVKEELESVTEQRDSFRQKSETSQRELEKVTRRLQNIDNEFRGTDAEDEIHKLLSSSFQNDRIFRRKRGAEEPDLRQEIVENGKMIGQIIYEVKDTDSWLEKFVKQAVDYKQKYNANYAVVVTKIFPENQSRLCIRGNNIIIVSPRLLQYITQLLRDAMVQLDKLNLDERDIRQEEILRYLKSQEFKQRVESVDYAIGELNSILSDEKRKASTRWERQNKLYGQIQSAVDSINNNVTTILEKDIIKSSVPVQKKVRKRTAQE